MTDFLPTDDTEITTESVQPWMGQTLYVDLGDSIATGGEFTARLVGTKDEYLVFQDEHGQFFQRMDGVVHMNPA